MSKIILVTGGFDPLHSGHIAYFKAAKDLGDHLIVGLNSDAWLTRKKGRPFMPWNERAAIIKELSCVDEVIDFEDDEQGSACGAIAKILSTKGNDWKVVLANGGDRNISNIPEYVAYKTHPDVEFAWGTGGEDKKNSSSWILKSWSQPTTERAWGRYTVLDSSKDWQVKQLEFDAGKSLSDQRHFKRSEHWHVVDGVITMLLEDRNGKRSEHLLIPGDSIDIPTGYWHKAINMDNKSAKVIEVWLGKELTENDIERRD
jgi:D-beta-D-heptose 7-phosphate kinase/D-beta-D-heptose 1-phosphate adenosyltransferase